MLFTRSYAQEMLATTVTTTHALSSSPHFVLHPQEGLFATLYYTPPLRLPGFNCFMETYSGSSLILSLFGICLLDGDPQALGDSFAALGLPRLCVASPLTPVWGQSCSINSLLRPVIFYL